MVSASAAGVAAAGGSTPAACSLLMVAGSRTTRAMAADSLSMTGLGVPAGANRAFSPGKWKSRKPASPIGGYSLRMLARSRVLAASTRTRPVLANCPTELNAATAIETGPAARAGTDWPVPLKGTCKMSRPRPALKASMVR